MLAIRLRILCALLTALTVAGCGQWSWPWETKAAVPDSPRAAPSEARAEKAPATRPHDGPGSSASRPAENSQAATQPGPGSEVVAGSIVQVNDQFITAEDVLRAARLELRALPEGISERTFRARAGQILTQQLHRKVRDALLLVEARRRLTDPQKEQIEKEVEDTVDSMVARSGGSRRKLENRLRREGTSLEAATQEYRKALTIQSYLRGKFYPQVAVTRDELLEAYRKNLDQFSSPKKVQMQVICALFDSFSSDLTTRPADVRRQVVRERARARIDKAGRALRAGDAFDEVAKRLSTGVKANEGGVWPLMARGNFRYRKVEEAAFALEEGQISDVIETDAGFFLVKAKQVVPAEVVSFEQAQGQLEEPLRRQQYEQLATEYMQRLLSEATIVESERFIALAVDCAVRRFYQSGSGR